jgi:uncharacterized membrane protein
VFSRLPRRLFVFAAGFLLVASLATAGLSGVGIVAGQAANGTNTTNGTAASAPQGQLSRLKGSGASNATNATNASNATAVNATVAFARRLANLSSSKAQSVAENNPKKAGKLEDALRAEGMRTASILVKKNPKAAAERYLKFVEGNGPTDTDDTAAGKTNSPGKRNSGGGLLDFSVKKDVIRPTMKSLKTMLGNAVHWILKKALEVVVGTPVPEDGDGGIVFIPTNNPWASLYHDFFIPYVFPLAAVIALLGMLIECGLMPWRALRNPTYDQSRAFVGFILTLIAIVFTVPIISLLHLTVDIIATNVAPSAAELTQSTKGILKLSGGAILGVVVAYGVGLSEVLLLGLIYALRYGALFFIPWFLPLLIAVAYNAPHERLENLASHLLWQYIGLLIQVVPVAFLFRAAYEVEWNFGLGGLMGLFASGAMFLIAAGLPILTSIGLFKSAPSVQSVASGAAGYVAGSQATDYARQAPGEAARGGYQRMASVKTGIEERIQSLTGTNSPERGQSTINDFEDRTHRKRGDVPKQGEL